MAQRRRRIRVAELGADVGDDASAQAMMRSLAGIRATLVRTTTGGAGRRPTVMLAPELTAEQRRAVKGFEPARSPTNRSPSPPCESRASREAV